MRVAIATIFNGAPSYACALPLWCQSAAELSSLIENSTVLIVTNKTSKIADCPGAEVYWGWSARASADAAKVYLARQVIQGGWGFLRHSVLLKLSLIGLVAFDLVLFADLDVDLRPRGFKTELWHARVGAFLKSQAEIVARHDHESPINTGVWLAKPSAAAFNDGLHLLRSASWSATSGFGGIGKPRDLHALSKSHASSPSTRALLRQLAAGSGLSLENCWNQLRSTTYFAKSTWAFVAGNLDQGLFWQVFYLLRGTGTWSSPAAYHIDHFWGGTHGKPWAPRASRGLKAVYLARLTRKTLSRDTPCAARLRGFASRLKIRHYGGLGNGSTGEIASFHDMPGWAFVRSTVLPARSVVHLEPNMSHHHRQHHGV